MKHKKRTLELNDKIMSFSLFDRLTGIEIDIESNNQSFKEVLRRIEEDLFNKYDDKYERIEILSSILGLKYQPSLRISGEGSNGNTHIIEVLQHFGNEFISSVLIKK
jgi:hypothetical protein